MASNRKKPMNKKNKTVTTKKPVANKKVTVKAPAAKRPVAKRPVAKKPVVKPVETKVEQVSIAEQIPATICTCEKTCTKTFKTKYVIAGVIIVALLLVLIF